MGPGGKGLFQWLMPSPTEAYPLATRPVDRDIALLSVSFGTLLGLGAFVEHQIVWRWLVKDHLDATFQHEQRSLHVNLHLNLCNACPQQVAEYRLVVPYINVLKGLINLKKIPAMLLGKVMNDYHVKTGSPAAAAPLRWLCSWFLTLGRPHPQAGHPGPLPGVAGCALTAQCPRHPFLLCCSPNLLPHCDCHLQDPQDLGALGLEGLQHWARVHNLAIQSWTTLVKMSINPLITFLPSPHS
ncbi:uncharacterized protein LOC144129159 [Amblyomma americanum]